MTTKPNIRAAVIVTGRVQGVNFRYFTQQEALRQGVSGWVRNLPDGSVEGCFEGEAAAVRRLVEWCRQGPPSARVDGLSVEEGEFRGEFDGFIVRR